MDKVPVTQEYLELNIRLGNLKFIDGEWRYEKGWSPANIYLDLNLSTSNSKSYIYSTQYLGYLKNSVETLETLED